LNTLILVHLPHPDTWFWIVGGVLVVVGVVSAFILHDHILIISTAFCGAYMAVRAVAAVLGGYPNEV